MELQVKSNGLQVSMKKEIYDNLPEDSKRGYIVISGEDSPPAKDHAVKNEVKKEAPATGEKSEGKK